MDIREFAFGTPTYDESIQLRMDILRIPLGLDFSPEDLVNEYQIIHLGAFGDNGKMLGCLILEPITEGVIKMRQVAVLENCQGQGIGTAMVIASEEFTRNKGYKMMTLNARESAIPFYTKMNYNIVGDQFEEVGVPHFKMQKEL